jgi:hypothetical protein
VKGLPDAYENTCRDLSLEQEGFTEWIRGPQDELISGQFVLGVAWYEKRHTWYLDEHEYNPWDEPNATWYARRLTGDYPPEPGSCVMKYFDIEKDERLITTNSKKRPIVLLRRTISDWWNPINRADHIVYWLCLPLFTYKNRHNQSYVLNDQRLNNLDAFYIPAASARYPGVSVESAARFQAIQMIKEERLTPCKHLCPADKMSRSFRLSDLGLRLVLYHFYKSLRMFPELDEPETEYALFKEQINNLIDAAIK